MKAHHIATIALAGIVVAIGTAGIATAEYEVISSRGQAVAMLFDRTTVDRSADLVASNFDFKTYDDEAMNPELASDLDSEIAQTCPKAPQVVITSEAAKPAHPVAKIVRVYTPKRTFRRIRPAFAPVAPKAVQATVVSAPIPPQAIHTFSQTPGFTMVTDEHGAKFTISGLPKSEGGKQVYVFNDKGVAKLGKVSQASFQAFSNLDEKDLPRLKDAIKFHKEFRDLPKGPGVWRASVDLNLDTAKEIRDAMKQAADAKKAADVDSNEDSE